MNLPDLESQILYGRVAWAVVLAALALAILARWRPPSRRMITCILLGSATLQALPEEASAAHWLGLAFQWPSALFVTLCACGLYARWRREAGFVAMPLALAVFLAFAGGALYLDASGWMAQGLYFLGFGPRAAPLFALVLATLCVLAVVAGYSRPQALALFMALNVFMLLRLPTGNLWDALIDPFLWVWAVISVAASAWQEFKRRWLEPVPIR